MQILLHAIFIHEMFLQFQRTLTLKVKRYQKRSLRQVYFNLEY